MATIVTNPNYIQVDGARIQKGTRDIIPLENGVRLQNTGSGSVVDILVDGTTIDGDAVADRTELLEYLDSQGFKSGGTSPGTESVQSVTGVGVDNTDPMNPVVNLPTWSTISGRPAFVAGGANAADARTSLGLGTAATSASTAFATAAQGSLASSAVQPATLDSRLSAAQRSAIDLLVSPEEDYADMTEATAAIKAIIDALKA